MLWTWLLGPQLWLLSETGGMKVQSNVRQPVVLYLCRPAGSPSPPTQCGPKKELQFFYTCTIPNNAPSPPPPPPPAQLSYTQLRLPGLGAAACLEVRLGLAWSFWKACCISAES